jgi:hypothetical protein
MANRFQPRPRQLLAVTWLCIAAMLGCYTFQLAKIGIDLREDFWVYWQNNRFYFDPELAMTNGLHVLYEAGALERADQKNSPQSPGSPTIAQPGDGLFNSPNDLPSIYHRWEKLKPVYRHIFRGWVVTYDHLIRDEPEGNYQMDYPPLRSLVMTLWVWKVQAEHPGITSFPIKREMLFNRFTHRPEPVTPDVIHPMLVCNGIAEGISAIAIFFLVWIWSWREGMPISAGQPNSDNSRGRKPRSAARSTADPGLPPPAIKDSSPLTWQSRWGDPLLLIPPILLGIFLLLRPYTDFKFANTDPGTSLIDRRITSVGWWIFLVLRYTSVIALARFLPRPFRGIACATVAMTLAWINPPSILDSFGWPQWEAWLLPFFLVAAVLVSVDWWLTAGIVLGIGGMFKGQLFFIAPVLVLCPLFAGWIGRFLRIVTGVALGAGLIVWPWLINNPRANAYLIAAITAGALVCIASICRHSIWQTIRKLMHQRQSAPILSAGVPGVPAAVEGPSSKVAEPSLPAAAQHSPQDPSTSASTPPLRMMHWLTYTAIAVAMLTATVLPLLIYRNQQHPFHLYTILYTLSILLIPWFLPRRMLAAWLTFVFTAAIWLAGSSLGGSFSWWDVGFAYGTQKHQDMQLGGQSLSNLSSILQRRYGWELKDLVGTLHLPFTTDPIDLNIQSTQAVLFAITLLICTVAASVHLRRNDNKFLLALTAPSLLFVTLLTQMAARYTLFPAVVAAALIGVSFSATLFQLLLVIISLIMLGNQLLMNDPSTAPILFSITRPTYPDMGWMMLLLAIIFLVMAVTPNRWTSEASIRNAFGRRTKLRALWV